MRQTRIIGLVVGCILLLVLVVWILLSSLKELSPPVTPVELTSNMLVTDPSVIETSGAFTEIAAGLVTITPTPRATSTRRPTLPPTFTPTSTPVADP
ncbi:MAG: hypothetical protein AAF125_02275, partial [Chloroflexota bacterium]